MNLRAKLIFASLFLLLGLSVAAQSGYHVGQRVYWRDDSLGAWVKATILRDNGAGSVEQYLIKVEGRQGEESARIGMLRPADGSPRPPMPTTDPFRLSQLYGFHQERDAWPLPAEAAKPVANRAAAPAAAAPAPAQPAPVAQVSQVRAVGRPRADAAVLGTGMYANGEKMGIPGQTNFRIGKDGQKHIVTVETPGDESFLGRYKLKAGGSWSVSDRKDMGQGRTQVTESYNFPADADVLVISGDGTWFKQFAGRKTTGRWMDLGQNVVQLVGFEDDDWTGSVAKGVMTIRGPVGSWESGLRF
ncbi:MAG: hypothetical protein ABI672_17235 [Vicinamibacteria bacterium]